MLIFNENILGDGGGEDPERTVNLPRVTGREMCPPGTQSLSWRRILIPRTWPAFPGNFLPRKKIPPFFLLAFPSSCAHVPAEIMLKNDNGAEIC